MSTLRALGTSVGSLVDWPPELWKSKNNTEFPHWAANQQSVSWSYQGTSSLLEFVSDSSIGFQRSLDRIAASRGNWKPPLSSNVVSLCVHNLDVVVATETTSEFASFCKIDWIEFLRVGGINPEVIEMSSGMTLGAFNSKGSQHTSRTPPHSTF